MATQRRRRRDLDRSSVTEDRSRPKTPGTQGQAISDDAIRGRAYELYRQRGGQHGHDWDDWFLAERELRHEREVQQLRLTAEGMRRSRRATRASESGQSASR